MKQARKAMRRLIYSITSKERKKNLKFLKNLSGLVHFLNNISFSEYRAKSLEEKKIDSFNKDIM